MFGKLDNIFDNHYNSFGTFGQADEVLGDAFNNPASYRRRAQGRVGRCADHFL
ncbi:hypothetical protein [Methylomicrobium agile]|uniref:hypothetical protein n=1 Tax=Methylomicrobium agile TaxID=39774 RepID=UPI000A4DD59C|nr:hypothetical protein [Methylomicrobium agile]